MKTSERISNLINQRKVAEVSWECMGCVTGEDKNKIAAINKAMAACSEEKERLQFMKELLVLWEKRGENEYKEEALKVFGSNIYNDLVTKTMATLTADGKQFRVWYDLPACIGETRTDNCKKNLLFSVYSDDCEVVAKYRDAYLSNSDDEKILKRIAFQIAFPNGSKIYL